MNLKKPKFWDYKKPNIYSYLLLPITFLIRLLNLYKKFQFEIDDLINHEKAYKSLPDYEGRALLYQRFLLTDNV